jgi:hypothetical protein
MICNTLKKFLDTVRSFCCECDNSRKLVNGHCNNKKCQWYDTRQSLIDNSKQLSIFTKEGFYDECDNYLFYNYEKIPSQLWWSDMRILLEKHCDKIKMARPHSSWWPKISNIIFKWGFRRANISRISPINRAREYLYEKNKNI